MAAPERDDDPTAQDPAEVEPTDNSTGEAVDLDRVRDVEQEGSPDPA